MMTVVLVVIFLLFIQLSSCFESISVSAQFRPKSRHGLYKQVNVDIITLQEIWRIPYTEIVEIPGYTFTHKHRTANRGGGVGFYIRNTITYRVIPELSPFADNIFESITIEAKIHKKTYLLSSVYRSPNPPANTSINAQITAFNNSLEALLSSLNTKKLNTVVG